MLISLIATFFFAENVVETVIASSRTHQTPKWRLLSTIILMSLNIGALYFFFASDNLYLALIFQPTMPLLEDNAKHLSFLTLLWLIITADFVAKFIFIMAKCLVVSGPTLVAAHRRKAQTYQWLEYTSHAYRHWLPTLPWSYYLTASTDSTGYVHNGLCSILFLAYLFWKVKLFRVKLSRWWKSTMSMVRPTSFGFRPSTTELIKTGPTCSICYGEFNNPVQLSCEHIFCEECVTTWLDKQKTCPMCRTQVITGDNDWKDGKTSYCIQLV